MKKLIRSIALTVAAVLVFGMVAMAAPSTETNNTPLTGDDLKLFEDAIQIKDTVDGTSGISVGPVSSKWLTRAREFVNTHPQVVKGEVLTVVDIRHDGAADVTFNCKYFTGNGPFWVLHYYGNDWENDDAYEGQKECWELIEVKINGNGTYTFHSDRFSPFAFVSGTAGAGVVAPKTGEVIAISAILALIMMAGAVVCAKKARLQK